MLYEVLSSARDLSRMHEIASVLVKHGLGDLVRRTGLSRLARKAGKALHWERAAELVDREPEERVRMALEELGPTFVKVGQILSGRTDLLPPAWTRELARLREDVKPVPYEAIREQLLEDLGAPPEEVFEGFEEEPLAAGSIAQVHRARLPGGTRIVLKVRRPGIEQVVESDLMLLARLASRLEEGVPELRRYRPERLARQLARTLKNELDMRLEAKNAGRLAGYLEHERRIVIPRIHQQWTCERLCVMDELEGPSVGEWVEANGSGGALGRELAELGADAALHLVFVAGFFHADPHAGNLIILPEGRMGLLDFGMVGRLSDERRLEFIELLGAIVERDAEEVVGVLMSWAPDGEPDPFLLRQDCADFVERYADLPLNQLDVARVLTDIASVLRDNDLSLPEDVSLLLKVFITLDGAGRALDPDFVMSRRVEPFVRQAARELTGPTASFKRGADEVRGLIKALPADIRGILHTARRGRIHMEVDHRRLESFIATLDRVSTRIVIGLVTSALIVGTAIALNVPSGPRSWGMPVFALAGFASSVLAGVWLLWSLRRKKVP